MIYIFKRVPLLGDFYLEFNYENSSFWDQEWCCGEFFGCYWKVRLIYTPINRNRYDKTNDKRKGDDSPALELVESDREVQRDGRRDADSGRSRFSLCCKIANANSYECGCRRNWLGAVKHQPECRSA